MAERLPPVHMTKVAYGAQSMDEVRGWFAPDGRRGGAEVVRLTTPGWEPYWRCTAWWASLGWGWCHTACWWWCR